MPVESPSVARSSKNLRADLPEVSETWISLVARPAALALAVLFVILGGAGMELGPIESRVGLAVGIGNQPVFFSWLGGSARSRRQASGSQTSGPWLARRRRLVGSQPDRRYRCRRSPGPRLL